MGSPRAVYRPAWEPLHDRPDAISPGIDVYRQHVLAWVAAVRSGRRPAGRHMRAAAARFDRELAAPPADWEGAPYRFDWAECSAKVHLLGTRFHLNSSTPFRWRPWQLFTAAQLHGWRDRAGFRRFHTVYVQTAKGSGKTPFGALLCLDHTLDAEEGRTTAWVVGASESQMKMMLGDLREIAGASRICARRVEATEEPAIRYIGGSTRPGRLRHLESGSEILPFLASGGREASERKAAGLRASLLWLDEYHEIPDGHDGRRLVEAGLKQREAPLVVITTNAGRGVDTPGYREHQRAVESLAGDDPTYLAVIASIDPGDEERFLSDPTVWSKANPALDDSPPMPARAYVRRAVASVEREPDRLDEVLRLHGGVWPAREGRWLSADEVLACTAPRAPMGRARRWPDADTLRGWRCWGGLDLAARVDLSSLALAWLSPDEDVLYVDTHSWTHSGNLSERSRRDRHDYRAAEAAGDLTICGGRHVDYATVALRLRDLRAEYERLEVIAYDRFHIELVRQALRNAGCGAHCPSEFRGLPPGERRQALAFRAHAQSFVANSAFERWLSGEALPRRRGPGPSPTTEDAAIPMAFSIDRFEDRVHERRIVFRENALTRSALLGTVMIYDSHENRKPSKLRSTARIDPAVAAIQCVGAAHADLERREAKSRRRGFRLYSFDGGARRRVGA